MGRGLLGMSDLGLGLGKFSSELRGDWRYLVTCDGGGCLLVGASLLGTRAHVDLVER